MAVDFYEAFAKVVSQIVSQDELINAIYRSSIYNEILGQIHKIIAILLVAITLFQIFRTFVWDMVIKRSESAFEDALLLLYQKGVPFIIAGAVLIPTPWTENLGLLEYTFREGTRLGFRLACEVSQTGSNNFFTIPLKFLDDVKVLGGGGSKTFREFIKDPGLMKIPWDMPTPPEWTEAGGTGERGFFDFLKTIWRWITEPGESVWETLKRIISFFLAVIIKILMYVLIWLIENAVLLLGFFVVYFFYFVEGMAVIAKMLIYSFLVPLTVLGLFFERFSGMFWDVWRKFVVLVFIPVVLVFAVYVSLYILGVYYYMIMKLLADILAVPEAFEAIYAAAGAVAYFALIYFLFKRLISGSQMIIQQVTSYTFSAMRSILGSE